MINEIVITPDSFGSVVDNKHLLVILKDIINSGILVVDFSTGNWSKTVHDKYLSKLEQGLKDKIIVSLKSLKDRKKIVKLTNYDQPVSDPEDWVRVTKLHRNHGEIDFLIVSESLLAMCLENIEKDYQCIDNILFDETWEKLKEHDEIIQKNPVSFSFHIKKMLSHAKKAILIDPYLEPDSKNQLALELFANYFRKRSGMIQERGTIEIHTKLLKDFSAEVTKSRWLKLLKAIKNPAHHSFKVYFWDDNSPEDKFHDRYIVTDIFAVTSQHSFSIKEASFQETTWSLSSHRLFEKYTNNFSEEDPKFRSSSDPLIVTCV